MSVLDDLNASIEEANKISLLSKELEDRLSFTENNSIQISLVINGNTFNMDLLKIKKAKNRYKLKLLCKSNIVNQILVYSIGELYIKDNTRILRKFNNKISYKSITHKKENNYLVNIIIERDENEL